MAEEQVVAPVVEAPETPPQTTEAPAPVEFSSTEVDAMNEGWLPKEQFKGDPKLWRPADQWLDRGQFIRTIGQLRGELKSTQAQVAEAFKQGEKLAQAQYAEQVAELKAARRQAFAEGDFNTADKIEDRLDELKENKNKAQPVRATPETPPEFYQFVQRNPWYQTDAVMQAAANFIGAEFVKTNPKAHPSELYFAVENAMKSRFPDLYGGKVLAKAQPSTEAGGGTKSNTAGGNQGFSKYKSGMSDMELSIMKTMVRANPKRFPTEESYLKEYAKAVDGGRRG